MGAGTGISAPFLRSGFVTEAKGRDSVRGFEIHSNCDFTLNLFSTYSKLRFSMSFIIRNVRSVKIVTRKAYCIYQIRHLFLIPFSPIMD